MQGWYWDASMNYGRTSGTFTTGGSFRNSRVQAAVGPSAMINGVPTCLGTAGDPKTAIAGCTPLNLLGGPGSIDPVAAGYLPSQIGLRAQSLQFSGREIGNVVAGITRASDGSNALRANVDADQLSGFVELRPARGAETAPRIIARLARLSLPKQEADSVSQMLDNSGNPISYPTPLGVNAVWMQDEGTARY